MTQRSGPFSSVAITGMGCLCAAGANVGETMASLYTGRRNTVWSGAVDSSHEQSYPLFAIDRHHLPAGYWEGPESRRCGILAQLAAREALADAGCDTDYLRGKRVGVCIGTTVGNAMNNESFYRDYLAGRCPGMDSIRAYLRANPAGMVGEHFGLDGPRQCIANACSSGAVAIGMAAHWLRQGVCDLALAGGSDMLCRVIYNGFIALKITDSQPCRPFDRDRQGLNLGEGAGLVVMEPEADARRRGCVPHALLCGYGNCSDAYHISAPDPKGTGLELAVRAALAQAGIDPGAIAFINAHGTATPENDRSEGQLFARLFPHTPFHSTKGYTGHTLGAAGAIEAIFAIASLKRGEIAGSIGFETVDPDIGVAPVTGNTRVSGDYALSDSIAFGGNNAVLIFRRAGA